MLVKLDRGALDGLDPLLSDCLHRLASGQHCLYYYACTRMHYTLQTRLRWGKRISRLAALARAAQPASR